jgi:hypothetical protein
MAGCDVYAHTNPYDAQTELTYVIAGPDTLFSVGQIVNYKLQSAPALSDTAGIWSCDCTELAASGGPGNFEMFGFVPPPVWPETKTVRVNVAIGKYDTTFTVSGANGPVAVQGHAYRRILSRTIVLTQRAVVPLIH